MAIAVQVNGWGTRHILALLLAKSQKRNAIALFRDARARESRGKVFVQAMMSHARIAGYVLALAAGCISVAAQQSAPGAGKKMDLTAMNIEDLMNIEVISVSKIEQKLSRTASAVFVIEREDIRNSGALNIPDLLRMVPGVDVAQITSNTWAIGVRGFNNRFSNKLLVMLDGRAVYTPSFGGVFWDTMDTPLEDIERIEVIRGPGGSVWGANAVDGVINIITRNSADTQGGLVTSGGGNLDQGFGTIQYGGMLDKSKVSYRIYSKYMNQNHLPNGAGQEGGDGWQLLQGGFRADTALSSRDTLSVQGNMYTGREHNPAVLLVSISPPNSQYNNPLVNVSGGYLRSSWNHFFSSQSDITLNVFYDAYRRDDVLAESRKTLAVDLQHHFRLGDRHNVIWGLGYRYSISHSNGNLAYALNPGSAVDPLFSTFVQDELALVPERLYLTVGTKVERNYYTGWAAMPSARLAWQAGNRDTFWAAFSSAIRTPNETDIGSRINTTAFLGTGGIPTVVRIVGNPNYRNENLYAYEAGYRTTVANKVSMDLAVYYNVYRNQQTIEPGAPFLESTPAPLHLVIPQTFQNEMKGEAHGLEISTNWKVLPWWSLSPGYALELIHMRLDPASQDGTSILTNEGSSPRHSAQIRSRVNLPYGWDWDTSAYFNGPLKKENVPGYTRVDTQLSWRWSERGTISVVGQNLLRDHHFEFQDFTNTILANQVKRSVYAQVSWRF